MNRQVARGFGIPALAVVLASTPAAWAEDHGFRLADAASQTCRNAERTIGRNRDFLGECGLAIKMNLSGRDLRGMNLKGAFFIETVFSNANLEGADFTGGIFQQSNFGGANLRNAKMQFVRFREGEYQHETSFASANLEGADLSGAERGGFPHPDFSRAKMAGANLSRTVLPGHFNFADLTGANFEKSQGGQKFVAANLTKTNFRESQLAEAEMRSAVFFEADFTRASLPNARLNGANLSGANFSFSNLSRADLEGSRMYGTDFRSANLSFAKLGAAHVRGADFRGALLCGAEMSQMDIQFGFLVTGAQYDAHTKLPFPEKTVARMGMKRVDRCR